MPDQPLYGDDGMTEEGMDSYTGDSSTDSPTTSVSYDNGMPVTPPNYYTPSGNNILNTSAVTTPLQPIFYFPDTSNVVDNMPRANPGSGRNYLRGHIADSSITTGKFGALSSKLDVTNFSSAEGSLFNSDNNENYFLESYAGIESIIDPTDEELKSVEMIIIVICTIKEYSRCNKYNNKVVGKTYYIVKKTMANAEKAFSAFVSKKLKRKSFDKVIIDTHGFIGLIFVNGEVENNVGTSFMDSDNFLNPKNATMAMDAGGLRIILQKISKDGQVVFLPCMTGCFKEEARERWPYDGRELGKDLHKVNLKSTLYIGQAFNNGSINDMGDLYYHYFLNVRPAITWGFKYEYHDKQYVNHPKMGFVKFQKGKDLDLGSLTDRDGNLLISGKVAMIIEANKSGESSVNGYHLSSYDRQSEEVKKDSVELNNRLNKQYAK
ncbi:hypothetical protein CJD36_002755 [Flavipsychrobacter stenotrophus]|uniref:Uncharacterized protein n=1 Tax=Flavipsychrobacter stenotrophus TaxID=2077091 RepID=A0A2S7T1D4_9BACT|nr:hypothetical protein [Flavipsychrobacter stenotrophus]PQJ12681.1 hypothetical protein CJD36_002755 [Flavipsychrobacter stenotrophus]